MNGLNKLRTTHYIGLWFLVGFILHPVVHAQELCLNPAVQYFYEGNQRPDELPPDEAWQVLVAEPGVTWDSVNGKLYVNALSGMLYFYRPEALLRYSEKFSIEAKVYVGDHQEVSGLYEDFIFGINDRLANIEVSGSAFDGKVKLGNHGVNITYDTNVENEYSYYKIVVDKSDPDNQQWSVKVYVNGEFAMEEKYLAFATIAHLPNTLYAMSGANSESYWDYVRVEICLPPPEPPPVEEQIVNIVNEVHQIDTPWPVTKWIELRLEDVNQAEDPLEQGRIVFEIGSHLFMMKYSGVVDDDAERVETLLHFLLSSVAPEMAQGEGYREKVNIIASIPKISSVVPGQEDARARLIVNLEPSGQHVSNSGKYDFAIMARTGVVDLATGEVVRTESTLQELPSRLPGGSTIRPAPVDFTWDGLKDDGTVAEKGDTYFFDTTTQYVQLDKYSGEVAGYIDQTNDWQWLGGGDSPVVEEVIQRHYHGIARKVTDVIYFPPSDGRYFITTDNLRDYSSEPADPELHLLKTIPMTPLQAEYNDDCDGMGWIDVDFGGFPAKLHHTNYCINESGDYISCPSFADDNSRNSCISLPYSSLNVSFSNGVRVIVNAFSNNTQGVGDIVIWKEERIGSPVHTIEYRIVDRFTDISIGGTKVRLMDGWYAGDEMDLIIPSPEKSRSMDYTHPDLRPAEMPGSIYVMSSSTEIAYSETGNGMGEGVRLTGYSSISDRVIVGTNAHVEDAEKKWAVSFYVNDLGNPLGDTDNDGLGPELELSISTDHESQDTDEDGIWDGFEVLGIRAGNTPYEDQALPTWGADPRHKDVFVESDFFYYTEEPPRTGVVLSHDGAVIASGAASRCSGGTGFLENTDGRDGFALHVDNGIDDQSSSLHGDWRGTGAVPFPCTVPPPHKVYYFDCVQQYWDVDEYFSPIRRGIFRYSVGSDGGEPGRSGTARRNEPYNWYNSTGRYHGQTFIHELGHNLNLGHDGELERGSHYNYKPHYISLMNYRYSSGSPNPHETDPRLQAWDSKYIRFSEGERRFKTDGTVFELNPAQIDETVQLPIIANNSNTLLDFGKGRLWHRTFPENPVDWVQVDWDRSGGDVPDSMTRADVLHHMFDGDMTTSEIGKHAFDNTPLRFGPQLVENDGMLYLFYVREGTSDIDYRIWYEDPAVCDPDDIHIGFCGYWVEGTTFTVTTDTPLNISSDMSAVSIGPKISSQILIFYRGTENKLCAIVQKKPVPAPPESLWDGPYCTDDLTHGLFYESPEVIKYNDTILVFGLGELNPPNNQDEVRTVKVLEISTDDISDPGQWVESNVQVTDINNDTDDLKSKLAPALAVDPGVDNVFWTGDESILGITTDEQGYMRLFQSPENPQVFNHYEKLVDEQRWLFHPMSPNDFLRVTYHRPALLVERLSSGLPKWTVWFSDPTIQGLDGTILEWGYAKMTSSIENDGMPAFSVWSEASMENRSTKPVNASLEFYNGKYRGAIAYYLDNSDRGFAFLPLANGIFNAALKDVNDVKIIGRDMKDSITKCSSRLLFHGMLDVHIQEIESANNIQISNAERNCSTPTSIITCSLPKQ